MNKPKNYITKKGLARLLAERDELFLKERPEVTKLVAWAAGNGDRSENADYQYGKRRLREIDRRVRFLNTRINAAVAIDPLEQKSDTIQFGATVTVENEEGERRTYSIVGADEIDTKRGLVSWKSPLGKALIGKKSGEIASFHSPGGEVELEILEFKFSEID